MSAGLWEEFNWGFDCVCIGGLVQEGSPFGAFVIIVTSCFVLYSNPF